MRAVSLHCVGDELLAAFSAGALSRSESTRVEAHLVGCEECRRVLAFSGSSGAVQSLAPTTTSVEDGVGTEPSCLREGTRVGRYVIRALVGAGAMGSVYSAHDPELARSVAIKVLRASSASSSPSSSSQRPADGVTSRMRREAQAMARLSHPNVVTVFDVGTFEGCVFVAMEFVQGMTLRQWLRGARRSWRDVLDVFENAGRGLSAAHAAGLVHRDFKPDNVLVGTDGRVRVTDFGLVCGMGSDVDGAPQGEGGPLDAPFDATLTRTGMLIGTPAYMAPEALAGGVVDARSDLFSFCVALYEGLYGERPFHGATLAQLRASIADGGPRPADRATGVPAALRAALLTGLRARPEQRPSSMNALLGHLRAASNRRSSLTRALGATGILAATGAAGMLWLTTGAARAPVLAGSMSASPLRVEPPAPAQVPVETVTAVALPPAPTASLRGTPATLPRAGSPRRALATAVPSAAAAAPSGSSASPRPPAAPVKLGANGAPILR